MSGRRLIVNADDYGDRPEIDSAVEELLAAHRLGGVSVLANGRRWRRAVTTLRTHPRAVAGVHLNALEGHPVAPPAAVAGLVDGDGRLPGLAGALRRWLTAPRRVGRAVEAEWRAQIERLLGAGLWLNHADSHRHLHAFPPAFRCAARLCREYRIPALRLPREVSPARRSGAAALRASLAVARRAAAPTGLVHNDHFLGFARAGRYGAGELAADLAALPPGLTVLALHPSTADGVPYPALRGDRERRAVLDDGWPALLQRLGIESTSWAEAGAAPSPAAGVVAAGAVGRKQSAAPNERSSR